MIPIPKHSFFAAEGRLLQVLLWVTAAVFLAIMLATWIAAERAAPVMLDLETGRPVKQRPAL